jgi:urea ABC transporter urea binding protein
MNDPMSTDVYGAAKLTERLEQICDSFDDACRRGQKPRLEDFLHRAAIAERSALLPALLRCELSFRAGSDSNPSLEEYLCRFPDHADLIHHLFREIVLAPRSRSVSKSTFMEQAIEAFEESWQHGERPAIDEFLPTEPSLRAKTLSHLAHIDLEYRWRAGEDVQVETYAARHPELAKDVAALLELVVWEFQLRKRKEPALDLEEYRRRFPQLEPELSKRMQSLAAPLGTAMVASPKQKSRSGEEFSFVQRVCKQFAEAWQAAGSSGAPPRIEDYLGDSVEPVRRALLEELVSLDIDQRRGRGEQPQLKNYQARFPELGSLELPGATVEAVTLSFLKPANEPDTLGWLGTYRVRALLGAGGMGMVFLAEDTLLERQVALKVIQPELSRDLNVRLRFLREARALAAVKHEHVVTVYQVGTEGDAAYLAMEFLEGQSLDEWLKQGARPSVAVALCLGRQIASGLAAAHERGLIHRDVKPANIWLESSPPGSGGGASGPHVKLLDFGLVRPANQDAVITQSGYVVGTPAFMSPEQARAQALDARSDLFSLGCVLYQLCTGRPPFLGSTTMAVLTAIAVDTPPPIHELNPEVPVPLSVLVSQLLAKNPAERPNSAREVVAALQALEGTLLAPCLPMSPPVHTASPVAEVPHRTRAAERRQVTVLVCRCDLFESRAYLENLEAEDQAQTLCAFEEACAPAIQRFGGTILQRTNEGLLACFGYPIAHEDAARRAAQAGLAIMESTRELADSLRRDRQLDLQPWVGVHTGPAIVETKDTGISVVGEARNVVVRLGQGAEPGQVACTETTQRLLQGHFDTQRLGTRKIRGAAQSLELFSVRELAALPGAVGIRQTRLTPLIGRDHEVSLLQQRWQQAQEGMGQVILLAGDAGLGKSRLVQVMKEYVQGDSGEREEDRPVIEWRCSPHHQNSRLYPHIDFVERSLGFSHDDAPGDRLDHMVRRLERYDLARPDFISLWMSILSLPPDERYPPLQFSPARQREEMFRTMLEWLHARAIRRPTLFIVEDLHWADATSLEFLGQFIAQGPAKRILAMFTFRPEFRAPWPASPQLTSLPLNTLTRAQAGALMRAQTDNPDLKETLVDQVYERTGGIPLFVEEFTRMMQESGVLELGQEGSASAPIQWSSAMPSTLQDLIMARLDRYTGDRATAQLAAALGREFSYELLAAVVRVDEPTLQAELTRLLDAEILYPKGPPPRRRFIFKHTLLQEAAYNSMVKSKRQQNHRRIAEVVEAQFGQIIESQPELLAHHCTEAGLTEKAVAYWLRAGLHSRERYADVEAIGHLTRGLALHRTLPPSPDRDAQELQFLTPLGTAYIAERGYAAPEVGPVFARARELCERIGQPQQLFATLWGTFAWQVVRGEFRLCTDLAAQARELADRFHDPGMLMEALFLQGLTLLYRGDFAGARDHCTRALADYDDAERTLFWSAQTGQHSGVTTRCYLALALWHLGCSDQALAINRQMRELAEKIAQPFSMEYALHHTGWLHQHCRSGTEVEAAADEEIRIAVDQGFVFWRASGTLYKAAALLLQGRLEEGLQLLQEGLDAYRGTGAGLAVPYYLSILAAAQMEAREFESARRSLDESLALAEKNDDRFQEAELFRLKGELLRAEAGDQSGAEDCFRRAIETARRQQSKAWELRATMSLARLWRKQGRHAEAHAVLVDVHRSFTEGFSTPDLVDATALLATLTDGSSRQDQAPAALATLPPPIQAKPTESISSAPAAEPQEVQAPSPPPSGREGPVRPRAAERRQVTVLICGCDLFESEAYLCLEPEDQGQVARGFRQTCEQVVRRFDGAVVLCNEQGLLACFGYPVAYEDAAHRAARTGLALLTDMRALSKELHRQHKLELNPWVGLHTGPAVVETVEGAVSMVGEARIIALRLKDLAVPGQVLCTESTHRLLQGQFECVNLGPGKIKGVAQEIELFSIQGVRKTQSPLEVAGAAELTPLIGRDHEIGLLLDRWEQARRGNGQVVLLIGEAGLGKSRLVYTLKEHVLGQMVEGEVDAPVIEWRCSLHYQNTSLYPAVDFYERSLAFGPEEPPQARIDRLLHRLQQYDLDRPETVPLWTSLLSLPTPDGFSEGSLSPTRQREEIFRTMLEWLHTRAARRPVLLVVEDLHWVDASTLEFLQLFLAEGLPGRILTLLTFRPEFQTSWPAVANQTSLSLNRLTHRQVGELMRRKTGGDLPEALIEQVFDRTGGVPLFVEEFTKMVQETGAPGGALPAREIPATLQDLVMARLDRMQGKPEVAQLAATLGREFTYELLAAVAELDDASLRAELAKLVQAEIVFQKGRPPRCNYLFKHALLEDAAYNSMVKSKRQQIHRRVAEVLEARFPQTVQTQPELLAHHLTEAGLTEKAVGYWLKAGLRSRKRSAEAEAIGHLTKGLTLLASLPDTPARDVRELELLNPLGTASIASRGYSAPEVGQAFYRARQLCERIGQPSQLFTVMWGAWQWRLTRGELPLCMELVAETMELAGRLNEPGVMMEALYMPALTLLFRGVFADSHKHFHKAVAHYDDRTRTSHWGAILGQDSGIAHRCWGSLSLWHIGYPDQALKLNAEGCQLARASGRPYEMCHSLLTRGWLCHYCRLGPETQAASEEQIRIAEEQGFPWFRASGLLNLAGSLILQGKPQDAVGIMRQSLETLKAIGFELVHSSSMAILGDACTRIGRFKDAQQALEEGLAFADRHDERFEEPELYRLKGELLVADSDDQAAAEDCFRRAIETARRQQSKAWELRATVSLASLWQNQGRATEARVALAAVRGTFTEGFSTPDLVDAAALLRALEEARPPAQESSVRSQPPGPTSAARPPRKRSWRRWGVGVGVVVLLLFAGGLIALFWHSLYATASGKPIKVGILHSRTGPMAISEKPVIDATLFAIDELNARGGILGRKVEAVVEDGASDWPTFARKAEKLITEDKVSTLFGCWTSASRKMVKPIVEKHKHLLFYPLQSEGLEVSPNIVHTGAAPNQQIIPAIKWFCSVQKKRRLFLVGSDSVFPRAASVIVRDQAAALNAEIVGEAYLPLGSIEVGPIIEKIKARNPEMIINTIYGDDNVVFFRALRNAGLTAEKLPTLSFSISEEVLSSLGPKQMQGNYAAWNYFQSIDSPENQDFVARFRARFGPERAVTDPMEAAYIGVHLWAQAVATAGSDDAAAIRRAISDQSFEAPEGTVSIDPDTHYLYKFSRIGKVTKSGDFEVVYCSDAPRKPIPYPATRSRDEWDTMLTDLHLLWGGQWANPDR